MTSAPTATRATATCQVRVPAGRRLPVAGPSQGVVAQHPQRQPTESEDHDEHGRQEEEGHHQADDEDQARLGPGQPRRAQLGRLDQDRGDHEDGDDRGGTAEGQEEEAGHGDPDRGPPAHGDSVRQAIVASTNGSQSAFGSAVTPSS